MQLSDLFWLINHNLKIGKNHIAKHTGRKLLPFFFILVLLMPLVSTHLRLTHQRRIVRKEIKRKIIKGIDKDKLVKLSFTAADAKTKLRWEHSREFEYNGEMYDIVEKSVSGDTTHYWCWWDNEETQLNRQLAGLVNNYLQHDTKTANGRKNLHSFLKQLYFYETINIGVVNYCYVLKPGFSKKVYFYSYTFPPPVPPPEVWKTIQIWHLIFPVNPTKKMTDNRLNFYIRVITILQIIKDYYCYALFMRYSRYFPLN